ncbi:MAG TPA: universal stress protein [Nocardioidaceae bacterium]|nr:universal stress protein [Nocardioidaceae bacterium]
MTKAAHPIVVGYDGSADSDRALEWAIATAKLRRLPIRLVAVHDDAAPAWLSDRVEDVRRHATSELSAAGDRPGGIPVTVMEPRYEEPSHALLRLTDDADLVVIGAQGHGFLSGMVIGSVSQHLSRHAKCPVVVVREPHDAKARRIIVGYDDSPGSERALDFAFETAELSKAPITVIHGWHYSTAGTAGTYLPMSHNVAEEISSERTALRESLAGWIEKHPEVAVEVEAIPVHPVRVLSDASEHAALVVVGSHGRGAFTGMLLGSVSLGVLHHARCPVVVAR